MHIRENSLAPPRSADGAWQQRSLRVLGTAGAALFAVFFAFTFAAPESVEKFAAEFLQARVLERVDATIDSSKLVPDEGLAAHMAAALYTSNEHEIESLRADLKTRAHVRLVDALAEVRDPGCECRRRLVEFLERGAQTRLASLLASQERIVDLIQGAYMTVAGELTREIRIFTAINAGSFLLLVLVSLARPRAATHLFFPGALLLTATLFCAWMYVFSQNWLLTIIDGSYAGFAYAGWLGLAFLFLCDIALNHARITTHAVNSLTGALGSSFQLVPC